MIKLTNIILFFLYSHIFAQETNIGIYKEIFVAIDWSLEEKSKTDESIKGKAPYFMVTKQDDFITKVEYFDSANHKAHFLLEPMYNIYFSKAELLYTPGKSKPKKRIVKMILYDFMGNIVGMVVYNWDNKSIYGRDGSIRSVILFVYNGSRKPIFSPIEKRSFVFGRGGKAFDRNIAEVSKTNNDNNVVYSKSFYKSGNIIKKIVLNYYNQHEYTEYYNYSFGKLKSKVVYNKNGVKISEQNFAS